MAQQTNTNVPSNHINYQVVSPIDIVATVSGQNGNVKYNTEANQYLGHMWCSVFSGGPLCSAITHVPYGPHIADSLRYKTACH